MRTLIQPLFQYLMQMIPKNNDKIDKDGLKLYQQFNYAVCFMAISPWAASDNSDKIKFFEIFRELEPIGLEIDKKLTKEKIREIFIEARRLTLFDYSSKNIPLKLGYLILRDNGLSSNDSKINPMLAHYYGLLFISIIPIGFVIPIGIEDDWDFDYQASIVQFNGKDFHKAEDLAMSSFKCAKQYLGSDNLEIAKILDILASIKYEQGCIREAFDFLNECIKIREKHLMPEHPLIIKNKAALESLMKKNQSRQNSQICEKPIFEAYKKFIKWLLKLI